MKLLTANYGLIVGNLLAIRTQDTNAFSVPTNSPMAKPFRKMKITLCASPTNEKTLRAEITEKSTIVDMEDEIKYATTIGEGANADGEVVVQDENEKDTDQPTSPSATNEADLALRKKVERAIKPRAYPLFLAEKGAIIVQDAIDFVLNKNDISYDNVYGIDKKNKERIVILGTGWGAAAFLKEIDTTKFDVTIISPRNFFLFTPMLAGASVGTVEYRSITENIRGVSSNLQFSYLTCS